MEVKKINKGKNRIPYKYMVIIENGRDWRLFSDYDTMCEFMGLDKYLLAKHLESRSFYTAYNFTVFRVQEENKLRHRGYHRS